MTDHKNIRSGEVNTLSLVVRKDIVRRGLSLASYMLVCPLINEGVQAQTNPTLAKAAVDITTNNAPIPKRA